MQNVNDDQIFFFFFFPSCRAPKNTKKTIFFLTKKDSYNLNIFETVNEKSNLKKVVNSTLKVQRT